MLPHDPKAFTQGLAIHNNFLYESTGLYGHSSLRKIDIQTGKIINKISLPNQYFAEGIAIIGNNLIQITWKEQVAFVYDLNMNLLNAIPYKGDGWGLCQNGIYVLMSNGSSTLTLRQPDDFSVAGVLNTHSEGYLNDLECVGEFIYANVWKKDIILKIDKFTGRIVGKIDASNLLHPHQREKIGSEGVLNGIAYHPQRQTFFLTGKYWPAIFEVKFVKSL